VIKVEIDFDNYSVTNHALPGHVFYPGSVTRSIVADPRTGDVQIVTVGEGTGDFMWFNLVAGPLVIWEAADDRLRMNFQLGAKGNP
jgi:hypothetical protein